MVGERTLFLPAPSGVGAVARFEGISDSVRGEPSRSLVTIGRSELPPLEEGEYYHADLIGLRCESEDGVFLGTVIAVDNFGGGDIIEIERPDGKKAMLPLRATVAELQGDHIVADPVFLA